LAELFPKTLFVGMDFSKEAIQAARDEAFAKGLKNVEFVAMDLSNFDRTAEADSFDFITTFDAVHDQGKPLNVLKGIHQALKRDGVYLMQDMLSGIELLHKMPGPHNVAIRGNWFATRVWRWFADATIYLTLFISMSGIYLWYVLKAERKIGLTLLTAGALSFFGLIYAVIH
jgi:SAM-dependent methyltransferase